MSLTSESIERELKALVDRVEADIAKYQEVSQTNIPTSLKQALDQRWELAFNVVEIAAILHYASEDQKTDHRRVIKLDRALKIIEQFENDIVQDATTGVFGTLFQQFERRVEFLVGCQKAAGVLFTALEDFGGRITWSNFFSAISLLVSAIVDLLFAFPVLVALLLMRLTFDAGQVTKWATGAVKIMKQRDVAASRMRGAAFPQRDAQRYRRRKLTRH